MKNIKNISKTAEASANKSNPTIESLLFVGFIGSACVHAAVMIAPVPALWQPVADELDDTIEIIVDTTQTQAPEEKIAEVPQEIQEPEPVNETVNNIEAPQPIEAAPVAIALAPEDIKPLKEGTDAAAPDDLKPLTTAAVSETKIQTGGGPVIAKNGIGSGFGNAKIPTGFVLGGTTNGNPLGAKNGIIGGGVNGTPNAALPTIPIAVPSQPSNKPIPKLECLSCPKPQYRGKEGTPRVTYDIAPDGRVINVRLRQSSGDAQTDRETLEAMSKWQFNPQTVPEGGRTNVRVRVTFEEEGSRFQRENEARRRQEVEQLAAQQAEQRRLAEQSRLAEETRQREAETANNTTVTAPLNPEPTASPAVTNVEPIPQNIVEPIAAPAPPAPIVEPEPPVAPPAAAIDIPPPPPVEPITAPASSSISS